MDGVQTTRTLAAAFEGPVVAFHANKGGVGKTTMVASLAWELAARGEKVLMVDADPQCNLSAWLSPRFQRALGYDAHNILELIDPVVNGHGNRLCQIKCPLLAFFENGGQVMLLPGHFRLSEIEPMLSYACYTANQILMFANLPGALTMGIRATAFFNNATRVIVDLSPSAGTLNNLLAMSCDQLLVPVDSSTFSVQALLDGGRFYKRWADFYDMAIGNTHRARFALRPNRPKLLGFTILGGVGGDDVEFACDHFRNSIAGLGFPVHAAAVAVRVPVTRKLISNAQRTNRVPQCLADDDGDAGERVDWMEAVRKARDAFF